MDYFDLIQQAARRQKQKVIKSYNNNNEIPGIANEPTRKKTTKRKKSPETIVTDEICKHLLEQGYIVVKVNSSNLFSEQSNMPIRSYIIRNTGASSGFPDIAAFKGLQYLLIEVKAERGRLSESQKRFLDLCNKHQVRYIVAKSIADVQRHIDYAEINGLPSCF